MVSIILHLGRFPFLPTFGTASLTQGCTHNLHRAHRIPQKKKRGKKRKKGKSTKKTYGRLRNAFLMESLQQIWLVLLQNQVVQVVSLALFCFFKGMPGNLSKSPGKFTASNSNSSGISGNSFAVFFFLKIWTKFLEIVWVTLEILLNCLPFLAIRVKFRASNSPSVSETSQETWSMLLLRNILQ